MTVFSPAPKPEPRAPKARKPIPRSRIKANTQRRDTTVARSMGSLERRQFVQSLPCAACGVAGFSVNAHLLGNGGMGRKKDATTIGPLCRDRVGVVGCHTLFDEYRGEFTAAFPGFQPQDIADETQRAWQEKIA